MKQDTTSSNIKGKKNLMVFGKENYFIFFIGIIFILVGFVLMAGGGTDDPNVFNEEIYSTTRIVIAPILVLIGFIIEIFAIMKKPNNQ